MVIILILFLRMNLLINQTHKKKHRYFYSITLKMMVAIIKHNDFTGYIIQLLVQYLLKA